ncbi:phosphotransferase [Kineococcus terrestris]|uniref:phosphotransferase n=1 Tax=Kineococcus terrestris TaxID=2044856 RepID=UPI0034DB2DD9
MSTARTRATERVLARVDHVHGWDYRVQRALAGGFQSGATLVRDPRRGPAVLKWSADPGRAPDVLAAGQLLGPLRAAGWPTPAWLASGRTPQGWPYQLQEVLPGAPAERITRSWLDEVLPLLDSHAGAAPPGGCAWSRTDRAVVFEDAHGHLSTVAGSSGEGAAFAAAVAAMSRDLHGVVLPEDDLVHGDLSEGNVLLVDGRLSGVVDVEALGHGSRLHDLATLTVHSALRGEDSCTARLLEAACEVADPGQFELSLIAVAAAELAFGVRHWAPVDAAAAGRTCTEVLRTVCDT